MHKVKGFVCGVVIQLIDILCGSVNRIGDVLDVAVICLEFMYSIWCSISQW